MTTAVHAPPASPAEHAAGWRACLPLAVDTYPDARFADIETAVQAVLGMFPDPPPAAAALTYQPLAVPRTLPDTVPHLYGLCGKPKAGKDVVADYLLAQYAGVRRLAFSDAILDEVNAYLACYPYQTSHGVLRHRIVEASKSEPHYRHLLQAWGMARREEDTCHWTAAVQRRVRELQASGTRLIIATGVRLPTDVGLIDGLGGQVLRVVRPGNAYQAEHEVEKALDHMPDETFVTVFNTVEGNLTPYEANIEAVLHGRPQPYLPAAR